MRQGTAEVAGCRAGGQLAGGRCTCEKRARLLQPRDDDIRFLVVSAFASAGIA
jgi:hypothetical protein